MVKYTTPLPCTGLSESNSKTYTNFEICEGKNLEYLKNTLIYKAKQLIYVDQKHFKNNLHIFEVQFL